MDLLQRAEAGQLSDFEISKLREIIILHINTDAADEAIRTLPENADDYRALKERVATRQYRFLSMAQTIKKTGLSRSTLERMEKEGTFPQRLTISEGRKGWHSKDVNVWMEAQEWATIIRNTSEMDDEERKYLLKFPHLIRTHCLHEAAKRLPERPWGCYESDDDEDE
ncbi:AlpA family phage regulatory protein [Klebsiella pneumoniae]|nr:AlpA family phage regulatory protein [Klebsiella pneumoniae]